MDKVELGQRLALARDDAGMTQEGLGRAVNLDRTAITRLEKGERKLNVAELVEISRVLRRPLSYFIDDPVPAVVSRRSDAAHAHSTTRMLDAELSQFAADVRTLLRMNLLASIERNADAHVPQHHQAAEKAAANTRDELQLDDGPLDDLARACERLGLFVFAAPLGEAGADGGCVEVSDLPSTLGATVVNGDSPAGRRRMTLAHELGHWLFGDAYDAEVSEDSERMINSFAIHFLAPRAGVQRAWSEHANWSLRDRALAVGASFRLSWSATVNQLRNLNLIGHDDHRQLKGNEPRFGDYLHLGLSWTDELTPGYLSPGFASAVLDGYTSQRLTEARVLELLRGSITADELPRSAQPPLGDLRRSFAGHSD